MGYCPLVALCLPLADLHHFCLTKGFPKTHSAICILHPSDCAWLWCLLSQLKSARLPKIESIRYVTYHHIPLNRLILYWQNMFGFSAAAGWKHGLRTPSEEIAFTAWPKIKSTSQIFRYGRSIFCLPHQPNVSDIFDLCLHWVSVVRDQNNILFRKLVKTCLQIW